jgi:endonuclease YncB( thermonuclease family)
MNKSFINFYVMSLVLAILCLPGTNIAAEQPWKGEVVGISDGDTIKVMQNGKAERVRLYGIDTPEMKQAFGKKAKQFTGEQVFRRTVKVVPMDTDRYGRTVALVYPSNWTTSLNEAIIKAGYAWVYRKYCRTDYCAKWMDMELKAKRERVGLWTDIDPVPPWEFRKK